ncbi:Lrp/AsnC family transcriptional regulator [Paenibacillus sp. GCM10027626]|uniref:Lrp/AsnC family transcriptional regulator n=1 Tax=Paenibacillus sp. GCM10027626 TaxID=3273411 RepID=UPI00363AF4B0
MLDKTDFAIIEELTANGRITMKELGAKVHMTAQAVRLRVEKLEDAGIILGYAAITDPAKLGRPVQAYINIYTKSTNHAPMLSFLEDHQKYIERKHKISGEGCYLVELRFPSNAELNTFLDLLNEYANYKLSLVIG